MQEGVDAEGDPDFAEDGGGGPKGGTGGHCVSAWDRLVVGTLALSGFTYMFWRGI